jgi:hypothetical protein
MISKGLLSFSYSDGFDRKILCLSRVTFWRYRSPSSFTRISVDGQSKNRWAIVSFGGGDIALSSVYSSLSPLRPSVPSTVFFLLSPPRPSVLSMALCPLYSPLSPLQPSVLSTAFCPLATYSPVSPLIPLPPPPSCTARHHTQLRLKVEKRVAKQRNKRNDPSYFTKQCLSKPQIVAIILYSKNLAIVACAKYWVIIANIA